MPVHNGVIGNAATVPIKDGLVGNEVGKGKWPGKSQSIFNCLPCDVGGAERDRTADLIIANDALSQLSYSPVRTVRAS